VSNVFFSFALFGECFPLSYVACCVKCLHFGFDFTLGCIWLCSAMLFQFVYTSSIYVDCSLVASLPLHVRGKSVIKHTYVRVGSTVCLKRPGINHRSEYRSVSQ